MFGFRLLRDAVQDPAFGQRYDRILCALLCLCGAGLRAELEKQTKLVQLLGALAEKVRQASSSTRQVWCGSHFPSKPVLSNTTVYIFNIVLEIKWSASSYLILMFMAQKPWTQQEQMPSFILAEIQISDACDGLLIPFGGENIIYIILMRGLHNIVTNHILSDFFFVSVLVTYLQRVIESLRSLSEHLIFIGGAAGGFREGAVFLSEEQLSTSYKPQSRGKRAQCKGECFKLTASTHKNKCLYFLVCVKIFILS